MTFAPSQCTKNCLTGRLTWPQVRARAGVPALGWAASSLSHHRLHLRPNPPFRHHRPRLAEVDGAELGGEDEDVLRHHTHRQQRHAVFFAPGPRCS